MPKGRVKGTKVKPRSIVQISNSYRVVLDPNNLILESLESNVWEFCGYFGHWNSLFTYLTRKEVAKHIKKKELNDINDLKLAYKLVKIEINKIAEQFEAKISLDDNK